ncbi:26796_t:CDS:1, partial [Gigaspora margarita]
YDRLFLQLKLKAQQETSIMVSIHETITDAKFNIFYIVITCNWLTKDFELQKILLLANKYCSEMEEDKDFFGDIIDALEKWELTNLKFYGEYDNANFIERLWDQEEENLLQYTIPLSLCMNKYYYFNDLENLIQRTLKLWARKNAYTQEMAEIIKAIKNAT